MPLMENWPLVLKLIAFGALVGGLACGIAAAAVMWRLAKWWKQGETVTEHKRAAWKGRAS